MRREKCKRDFEEYCEEKHFCVQLSMKVFHSSAACSLEGKRYPNSSMTRYTYL